MKFELTYLFDPLCGWCYGSSPAINYLNQRDDISLNLLPTGLFSSSDRRIDSAFAAYAWSNDARIQKLTGQKFTDDYKVKVLGNLGGAFDSTVMTLALTAISLTNPDLEISLVNSFQSARYIQGIDTSNKVQVLNLLKSISLFEIADQILEPNQELIQKNIDRIKKANLLANRLRINGVPALVQTINTQEKFVNSELLFGDFHDLITEVRLNHKNTNVD